MPPRMGKSFECSIHFPPWFLGRNPDKRIIATSYSADLSYSFSRLARNIISTDEYQSVFPGVALAEDSRSVSAWDLIRPHRGGYTSAGVGGSITGKGADVLLIDDPVKDEQEASSETVLENIWAWFSTTAYTRLEGDGAVVIIMTRWAEDDLVGRVLGAAASDPLADQWEVLRLPALAEEGDILGRAEGESLWPSKYSRERLLSIQATMGKRAFAAIYQQRPAPQEGNLFKNEWLNHYYNPLVLPEFRAVIQFWDTAYKDKQENDYSACMTLGVKENTLPSAIKETEDGKVISLPSKRVYDLYVLDVVNKKMEFPELTQRMIAEYDKWSARGYTPTEIIVEDKASGTSAYQVLKMTTNLPIRSVLPERDKINRANAVAPYFEQGRILYPANAPWLDEYQEQMKLFPAAKHDDMVDATTGAILRVLGRAGATAFLEFMHDQVMDAPNKRKREKDTISLPGNIVTQTRLA